MDIPPACAWKVRQLVFVLIISQRSSFFSSFLHFTFKFFLMLFCWFEDVDDEGERKDRSAIGFDDGSCVS